MLIEVIADTIEDAKIAEKAGANRIELITGVAEGGLTPSYGLIKAVCEAVSIPVYVMIRPHSRSFYYTPEELKMMAEDIRICKELGAKGVVFGVLNENQTINEEGVKLLVEAAQGIDITFHRAFDEVPDQIEAIKILKNYPEITRILTSGGEDKAPQAIEQFQLLVKETESTDLTIMAGAGLSVDNIDFFLSKVKVSEIHFGSGVHHNSSSYEPIDPSKIQQILDIASNY